MAPRKIVLRRESDRRKQPERGRILGASRKNNARGFTGWWEKGLFLLNFLRLEQLAWVQSHFFYWLYRDD